MSSESSIAIASAVKKLVAHLLTRGIALDSAGANLYLHFCYDPNSPFYDEEDYVDATSEDLLRIVERGKQKRGRDAIDDSGASVVIAFDDVVAYLKDADADVVANLMSERPTREHWEQQ